VSRPSQTMDKVNLAEKFAAFSEHWSPKIVGAVDDYEIKLVKVEGDFVWHSHAEEDELFLVIEGELTIALRDRDVTLRPGEFFVVPKGVEHKPSAAAECKVLLLERKGAVNTGDAKESDLTNAAQRI
jgi:mannose-6-phosphate isomerase-like protein (cupin superfamily)